MNCKFKKPDGNMCKIPALKKSSLCLIHDPTTTSIYFLKDVGKHKQGDSLCGISKEKARKFIENRDVLVINQALFNKIKGIIKYP